MVFAYRLRADDAIAVCGETRVRRFGYQLRCLEAPGHGGAHQWTPELVVAGRRRRPRG